MAILCKNLVIDSDTELHWRKSQKLLTSSDCTEWWDLCQLGLTDGGDGDGDGDGDDGGNHDGGVGDNAMVQAVWLNDSLGF